jgi:hypothetical protein
MKTVLLRAPVLTQSGYGVHARQIARWLFSLPGLDVKVQALPWGDTPWILAKDACDGLAGKIMSRVADVSKTPRFDATVQLQLPNEWDPSLGIHNIGMTAGVETDRCNPQWIEACNRMSQVIVPSTHVSTCLTSTGQINVPLKVVHESFSAAVEEERSAPLVDFGTPFNFLVFGQLTGDNPYSDRKNTFFALKWLFEEFSGNPDVGIVLKTNFGRNTLIDKNKVLNVIRNVAAEARKGAHPKIHLLHGDMKDEEVASLYRHPQVKALVAPTRGEGFGLPILEAAASGLPVIATGWSGHLDFLSLGRYISLYYNIEEVHASRVDKAIFVPGARWASPTEQDFKKKVRKFYSSPDIPQGWASDLRSKVRKSFSFEAISAEYANALKDVLC